MLAANYYTIDRVVLKIGCSAADCGKRASSLTALGLRNLAVQEWLPEAAESIGGVGVVPFRESGSFELGEAVRETMDSGVRLVILKGHGVVSAGGNLADAFDGWNSPSCPRRPCCSPPARAAATLVEASRASGSLTP